MTSEVTIAIAVSIDELPFYASPSENEMAAIAAQQALDGAEAAAREMIIEAKAAPDASDVTFQRCIEDGKTWPQEWKDYRQTLRNIISSKSTGPLPKRPAYP